MRVSAGSRFSLTKLRERRTLIELEVFYDSASGSAVSNNLTKNKSLASYS
jgi:hypothetical protein